MVPMTGICYININGARVRSKPDAKLNVGGAIREPVMDVNGYNGSAVKELKPGEVKFTLPHGADVDLVALQALTDVPVTFETDSKQVYLIRNASVVGDIELSGSDVEVTMAGAAAELV